MRSSIPAAPCGAAAVLVLLLGLPGAGAEVADLVVSPEGNDSWSGRLAEPNAAGTDGPLATLAAARDAVRKLKAAADRDLTVLVRGGTYRLGQTVVFTLDDSAADGHTITYAAYPGEEPVFSSGRPLGPWRKPAAEPAGLPAAARGKVWVADVSARGPFCTLFDGTRQLPRARGPGFSQINTTPRGWQDFQTVEFPPGAVPELSNPEEAELRIVPSHFWIMNLLPVASIDRNTCTLKTAVPGTYPLGRNGMTDRANAWIENALEVLDEPGEWVLDRAAGLVYLWPLGEKPADSVVAPALTELIRVEGRIDYDGPGDTPVEGLVFRGLAFRHGDRYPWQGRTGWGLQHDWECFDKPTALVRFRGAERCAIEDCRLEYSGHTAVRLDLHCRQVRVAGNQIHHVGGVGVLLAGYGPGTKNVNRQNEVVDNYIHHIGQEYWGSSAIFAWQSGENRIAHNHIHHIPYTAVLATGRIIRTPPGPAECSRTIRWDEVPEDFATASWAEREPYLHARKNVIEYNDIHNAMQKLGDGNCIYVSGAGGGNVVRYNYCHDCYGDYMNAVIRCDDDQHATLMEGNVCFRTGGKGEGFISKGDNDILNNVVADLRSDASHRGYIVFPYGSIDGSRIERNILYACKEDQKIYSQTNPGRHGPPPRVSDAQADHNLYFNTETDDWAGEHFKTQRPLGIEAHSLEADPQLADIEAGDFRFAADSPAAPLGIAPLDVSQAGLRTPYRRRYLGRPLQTRIEPAGGRFTGPTEIRIACSDPQAEIRYTLDGSEPSAASSLYKGPITVDEAGLIRARAFADGATDLVGVSARLIAPPAPIVEDFESVPAGSAPPLAQTSEDDSQKQYTVRVSGEQAAAGRQSLKFVDGPGQKQSFTPHVFYRRTFDPGPMVGRFDLRVDEAASLSYQWRHYPTDGYRTGPAIDIRSGGQVVCGGKPLLTIPTGAWVGFEIQSQVGEASDGKFTLCVRLPGGEAPLVFADLPLDGRFTRLDWIGFASKADKQAVYYVDNFEVAPAGE